MNEKDSLSDHYLLLVFSQDQQDLCKLDLDLSKAIVIIPGWYVNEKLKSSLLKKGIEKNTVTSISVSTQLKKGSIYLTPNNMQVTVENDVLLLKATEAPSLDKLISSLSDKKINIKYINSPSYKSSENTYQTEAQFQAHKFKLLFENSVHAFFCTDGKGSVIEANRAACEMFGYTEEEFKKGGRNQLLEQSEPYFKLLETRRKEGSASGVITAIRKNGVKFSCEYSSALFVDSNGNESASTILIDISEKEKKEKLIHETNWFMQMIFDTTEESFIILDRSLNVVGFNKKAGNFSKILIGKTLQVGDSIYKLSRKEDFDRLAKMYAYILENNSTESKYVLSPDGINKTIFKISYVPITNEEKTVTHIMVNAKDVTDEEMALEQISVERSALREALADIENIMNFSPDVICAFDISTGKFIRLSNACEVIFGYKKEEMLGRSFSDFVFPEDLKKSVSAFKAVIKGLNITNFQNRYVRKDGSLINILWSANFNSADKIMYAVAKDATEKIIAEKALSDSEEKYRHLFYANPIPMWIYEKETRAFLEVNDAAITNYGYSRSEFLSMNLYDIRPDTEIEKLKKLERSHNSEFLNHLWKHKKANNEIIDVEITSHPMKYEGKNAFLVSANDITQRTKLEADLIHYSNTVKNILASITDGFVSVDMNWMIRYSNQQAEDFLSESKVQLEGQILWKVNKGKLLYRYFKKFNESMLKKSSVNFEYFIDDDQIWLEITTYPFSDGMSIYFKNITERKSVEQKVQHLNESLQKRAAELIVSNEELEKFAYVASHDLQEPLRMITSFLQLFQQKYLSGFEETGQRYVQFAIDGASRMNRLILDLLEYSKVGRREEMMEKVNLNQVINEVLKNFDEKLHNLNAVVNVQELPVLRIANRLQMFQLLQNLVSNALKYQPKESIPQIDIYSKDDKENWIICIQDNGIGIEEKFAHKIFIIFQRLHSKNEYSGTGIGLAICKKIVELHGGKIWVEANEGRGSCFSFSLPKKLEPAQTFNIR